MRKKFSKDVEMTCNKLLTNFFAMNQKCDNMAYALDTYLNCSQAAKVYHLKFAHQFPSDTYADKFSEVLDIKDALQLLEGSDYHSIA